MTIDEQSSDALFRQIIMPHTTLQGHEKLKLLYILLAIDPSIGGLIIFGKTGTGKTQFLRFFKNFRIPLKKSLQCQYNCSISCGNLCSTCNEKIQSHGDIEIIDDYAPILEMPPMASLDAVIGNLDIQLNFRPGMLARVNNGFLLIDDLHLIPQPTLEVVMNVFQNHQNVIQRQSLSITHPSQFCIIASVNTAHHKISPANLDKFGFSYFLEYDDILQLRMAVINSNLLDTDETFENIHLDKVQRTIKKAREYLHRVKIPSEQLALISQLCSKSGTQGYRSDITLAKGARALASFQGRTSVMREDILILAPYVLSHRIPEEELDLLSSILSEETSSFPSLNKSFSAKERDFTKTPLIKDPTSRTGRIIERLMIIIAIFVISFLAALTIVSILSVPSIFLYLFSGLAFWGIGTFLLYLWVRHRKKFLDETGISKSTSGSNARSFSKVKQFRITRTPQKSSINIPKDVIFDIEEDQSLKSRVVRFLGINQRKGMITLSSRQRFWVTVIGIFILLFSLIFYSFIILTIPIKTLINILLIFLSVITIAFVIQSFRKKIRIRRVADVGASPKEKSKHLNGEGIGSHISPVGEPSSKEKPVEQYGRDLWQKLADLDLVADKSKEESGLRLLQSSSVNSESTSSKVVADALPRVRTRVDSKERSKMGKRALSITTLQSGRVIGNQEFKGFPRNIHLLATIRNSVIRNHQKSVFKGKKAISIELEDIREKKFCTRVSATIIFVLDLSESIVNTIKTVSASVNWLSRQAYLYRDRVGIVVLKGTQGVIIQPPTSNLNLVKRKLSNLRVSGSTPLAGGLQKAIELIKLDRIRSKNEIIPMIILITDGATNIPLLTDPLAGTARTVPLKELGLDRAVRMAIQDCISLTHQIKKEKISLTIFSANLRGAALLKEIPRSKLETTTDFLNSLTSEKHLFRGRRFIHLWSFTLLRAMQEITNGHLYFLSKYQSDENFETLRIARTEILSSIIR
ncbi:MAG: VWA domain-containing protein [Candidatus Hodarchaeota archaeon]